MMTKGISQEIEGMEYPSGDIGRGLEEEGVTDRHMAAAYGSGVAKEQALAIIRSHMGSAGWIPCSERLPEPEESYTDPDKDPEYIVTIEGASKATVLHYASHEKTWYDEHGNIYRVSAWRPMPGAYRPVRKPAGEDYKQQIMERFTRVE